MANLFRQTLRPLATGALLLSLALTAASLFIMRELYASANDRALGEACRALAGALPPEARHALASPSPSASETASARAWAAAVGATSDFRLTLVSRDGRVLADSDASPEAMENHGSRPEIAQALSGKLGIARRRSATVGMELFYAAVPLQTPSGELLGALRIAHDLPLLESRLAPARGALLLAVGLVVLAALFAAAHFSRKVANPLARLAAAASGFSNGAESSAGDARSADIATAEALGRLRSAAAGGPEEVRILGGALESMAAELAERIRLAEAAGRERRAILDGMSEAVLALGPGLELRLANPAARELFGLPPAVASLDREASPPSLLKASRSSELEAAAIRAREAGRPVETELSLHRSGRELFFQVLAAPLEAPSAEPSRSEGVVIVLNDITRLRRLERIRRDFVANVSHELRTPVQLVKGFAETLRDGAVEDPEQARRFAGIIERNAQRMERLIEDLLTLARLEQEEAKSLPREQEAVERLVAEALESLERKALEKGISFTVECPPGLQARVNGGLIVQALVNLLDNAIKYSPRGSPVTVRAAVEGDKLILEVRDRGLGVPAADLPRLFERFYRVDKARSREQGGTGLGLAIVRHIALAHGGSAEVESWEGEGSIFRVILPRGTADS